MDDITSSYYDSEGGLVPYEYGPRHAALPGDFFNDTNLNKFTPTTRPNTNSWKLEDTHLGIYINNIESDYSYADITVYKNYWSNPLLSRNKLEEDKSDFYEFEGYGYFGEQFSVEEEVTLELYSGANYTLIPETNMHLFPNSKLKIPYGSQLTFDENAKLTLEESSSMDIMQNVMVDAYQNESHEMSYLYLENGSNLKMFDGSKINGNLEVYCASTTEVQENSIVHLDDKAKLIVQNGGKLKLLAGSTFIIHENSNLSLEDGSTVEVYEGAEIIIEKGGQLFTNADIIGGTKINYMSGTGTWKGITSVYDNVIELRNTEFNGAETLLSALSSNVIIEKCLFRNCTNGVKLEGCSDYIMDNNSFEGIGLGSGIELVQSSGFIHRNSIAEYEKGMHITLSSPVLQLNYVYNNLINGLYIEGYNSRPQLIAPEGYFPPSNNNIKNNGDIALYENSAQIFMELSGMIYMSDGLNNVYSEPIDEKPDVPCILAKSTSKRIKKLRDYYYIDAENNYWGSRRTSSSFFDLKSPYKIDFSPFSKRTYPLPINPPEPTPHPGPKQKLYSAINNELEGNYDAARADYEFIINEYPESKESAVAYSKLPKNYKAIGMDMNSLLALYEQKLSEMDEKADKNFFKELKVISHILDKNFDEAILISEEMLSLSETEEEIKLAQKDIRIARLMKEAESNKGGKGDYVVVNDETEIETVLPNEFKLFQNYPNPFNPTTQIKYALSQDANVSIKVYNSNGSVVADLVNASQSVGHHSVTFDATKLSNGIFYYTLLVNGNTVSTKRMLLIK